MSARDWTAEPAKAVPVNADKVLILDSADSNNNKLVEMGNFQLLTRTQALDMNSNNITNIVDALFSKTIGDVTVGVDLATDGLLIQNTTGMVIEKAESGGGELFSIVGYDAQFQMTQDRANGTKAAPTVVLSNDVLGANQFRGWDGTAFVRGAMFRARTTEVWNGTSRGTELSFFTVDNTTTTLDERVKIQNDGDVNLLTNNIIGITNATMAGYADLSEITTPANPAANVGRLYVRDDATITKLFFRDSAGTEIDILAGKEFTGAWTSNHNGGTFDLTNVANGAFTTLNIERPSGLGLLNMGDGTSSAEISLLALASGLGGQDAVIQFTSDAGSLTNDWTIRMDGSDADKFQWRYDGAIRLSIETSGIILAENSLDMQGNDVVGISELTGEADAVNSVEFAVSGININVNTADNLLFREISTELFKINEVEGFVASRRIQGFKGSDVASADAITLGDGNYFDITGATTINHLLNTNWQAGSEIVLQFDSTPTITNAAGGATGDEADFALAGGVNWTTVTAGDTLTLVYDGIVWRETSRSVN